MQIAARGKQGRTKKISMGLLLVWQLFFTVFFLLLSLDELKEITEEEGVAHRPFVSARRESVYESQGNPPEINPH